MFRLIAPGASTGDIHVTSTFSPSDGNGNTISFAGNNIFRSPVQRSSVAFHRMPACIRSSLSSDRTYMYL